VILDTNPAQWHQLGNGSALRTVLQSLVIAINSHLALNSANKVAVVASHSDGARFLYPRKNEHKEQEQLHSRSTSPEESTTEKEKSNSATIPSASSRSFVSSQMYRQFKMVDETFLLNLLSLLESPPPSKPPKNTLSGSLSLALSYINKYQQLDPLVKASILVVNTSPDEHLKYIPIMNCIFAAQKMKIPINVCQLSSTATFLQQAADATSGVYLKVDNLDGLVQYFATAFFIDPSLKNLIVKPTSGDIDFRASCFQTGKVVDIGFVCSVCLCILSEIPTNDKCPACDSEFDPNVIKKLKRKPAVVAKKKKRKLNEGKPTPTA
jgi:transcription initiation factor TFIIH subunit 3